MAEKFDEFLEEVKNDIRQEKLLNLWRRYGKWVIGSMTVILVAVAGYNFWGQYDQNKRLQMAEKLITAQELTSQGEVAKALTILNSLSEHHHKVYQSLALFQKAGLLLQEGVEYKPVEAITIYQQLAANTSLDPLWRGLAVLLSVMVGMDQPNIKPEELLKQLDPLTQDQSPWRYFAKEMKGVLLYRQGENGQAAELFARLVQDNETPAGISMRARLMAQIVSAATEN